MKIEAIKTESDYQKALARLDVIFDAVPGTQEGEELDHLGRLIEQYEEKHFPI